LLDCTNRKKTLKLTTLYRYLTVKCKYAPEQVLAFFNSIDIDIYRPLIVGKLSK